jgi:hypothetical protein
MYRVGHRFTDEDPKPGLEKTRAVQEILRQGNVKDLQTLFGFLQYIRMFMPNLSKKGNPLRQLTENTA